MLTTQQLYVDLGNLDHTLKPLYETQIVYDLLDITGYYSYSYLVERNELNLEDDWWNVVSSQNKLKFNSLKYDGLKSEKLFSTQTIFECTIGLGSQTNQFGRKVLNFLEVTGIVGGIFEI